MQEPGKRGGNEIKKKKKKKLEIRKGGESTRTY